MAFSRLSFVSRITKGSGGGYRVWVPKKISKQFPESTWVIESTIIRKDGFKQSLSNHPFSKGGGGKVYIPIYCEEIVNVDYLGLGDVNVEVTFDR